MIFNHDVDLSVDYDFREPAATGLPWTVLVSHAGVEPVVLVHELPGITPAVAYLGGALGAAGFKVYMPSLFGQPGHNPGPLAAGIDSAIACVRSDIAAFARGDETRGVVAALRSLARQASDENANRPVGVIGLCLSGGFAIATATEDIVAAAVASEPSLPLMDGAHVDVGAPDQVTLTARVKRGDLRTMLLRFQGDGLSPCSRVKRFGEFLAPGLASRCVPDDAADPNWNGAVRHHSVLTNELVEGPHSLTEAARDEVIAFLSWRLRGGPAPIHDARLIDCLAQGCQRRLPDGPQGPVG